MDVVRDDERHSGPPAHLADARAHGLLFGDAVRHELEVVIAGAEDRGVLERHRAGRVDALLLDGARHLALQARRQGDEPVAVLPQELLVHARPVVVALEVRARHERDEVLVPGEVLRQQDEVERLAVAFDLRIPVRAAASGDVRLHAHDRLDARGLRGGVEVDGAVQRAVVRDREGRHAQGLGPRDEVAQPRQAVEQAVLTVGV